MAAAEQFTKIDRARDSSYQDFVWLHNAAPVWIVGYDATRVRAAFWQAYRSVQKVPQGRKPWSIDNRRIGSEDGFSTLEAAMNAAVTPQ